mmetsp:Transcript_16143/g.40198  ORF Transcript_16143/g.40198 Transcript_16143/m.40198 type:complete len:211 (-) Transcript_16143:118-750(-)
MYRHHTGHSQSFGCMPGQLGCHCPLSPHDHMLPRNTAAIRDPSPHLHLTPTSLLSPASVPRPSPSLVEGVLDHVLVRHDVQPPLPALVGREEREVGHVRRVQARVALDLVREARVLVARLEDLAPDGVVRVVVLRQLRRVARLERLAHRAQLAHHGRVLGVRVAAGRQRAVRQPPLEALDLVVQLVALLPQQAQLVLQALGPLLQRQLHL